jgi:hypothetical protein
MASWSYIGTPYSGRNKVRLTIGDTDENDQLLNDYEIDAMLSVFPNEIEAAAHLALALAARFAAQGDLKVDGYTIEYLKRADFFKELSKELFIQARGSCRVMPVAGPSYGGVSVSGKGANTANTENVQPAFYRGQFGMEPDEEELSE